MTINRVQEAYRVVKNNEGDFSWLDDEVYDLITAIAEHILKNPEPSPSLNRGIPEGYITIKEFSNMYPVFCRSTILASCTRNKGCNGYLFLNKKWYVRPAKLLEYLKIEAKGYERRMDLMSRLRKVEQ